MKSLRLLSIIITLLFNYNSFAYSLFRAIDCPPISQVTNVEFTRASLENFLGKYKSWLLTSNEYTYKGKTWNTAFTAVLPNVKNDSETAALMQGDSYFRGMNLSSPTSQKNEGHSICIYANIGDFPESNYVIGAITPAIHGPIPHM